MAKLEPQPRNLVPVDFSQPAWGDEWITADFPAGVFYLQSELDSFKEWKKDFGLTDAMKLTLTVVAFYEGEDLIPVAFDLEMPVEGVPEWVAIEQRITLEDGRVLNGLEYAEGRANGTIRYPDDKEDRIHYVILDYRLKENADG